MTNTEKRYSKKYKKCEEVTESECYPGGKICGTCMYCASHSNFVPFENRYCTCVKKER